MGAKVANEMIEKRSIRPQSLLYILNLALTRFTHHKVYAEYSLFANEGKHDCLVVLISSLETLLEY